MELNHKATIKDSNLQLYIVASKITAEKMCKRQVLNKSVLNAFFGGNSLIPVGEELKNEKLEYHFIAI